MRQSTICTPGKVVNAVQFAGGARALSVQTANDPLPTTVPPKAFIWSIVRFRVVRDRPSVNANHPQTFSLAPPRQSKQN